MPPPRSDARLVAEIEARERHRERIAGLAAGDSLALPPEGAAYSTGCVRSASP